MGGRSFSWSSIYLGGVFLPVRDTLSEYMNTVIHSSFFFTMTVGTVVVVGLAASTYTAAEGSSVQVEFSTQVQRIQNTNSQIPNIQISYSVFSDTAIASGQYSHYSEIPVHCH